MCPNSHEIILDFCNSVDIFLTYITFSFMVQNKLLLLLHPFNSYFSRTTWVSWYQKGKTSLDLNKAKDDRVSGCSGISWTICKQSAPRCRQITHQHLITQFLQVRYSSWSPTNIVKSTEGTVQNKVDSTSADHHTRVKIIFNYLLTYYYNSLQSLVI